MLKSGYTDAGLFLEKQARAEASACRQCLPIIDNGESLQSLPSCLARCTPHPYQKLGAPYGETSPFMLRTGVVKRLVAAQEMLEQLSPGCQLQVFDAYRPLAVQAFMIEHETGRLALIRGLDWENLAVSIQDNLRSEVRDFWADPNPNPKTPPPHSTGAAVDLTIVNTQEQPLPMGTAIDHVGPKSLPYHFADSDDAEAQQFHRNRHLLNQVMSKAGFRRLPSEWWHFSYGDQWWALLEYLDRDDFEPVAVYGRVSK